MGWTREACGKSSPHCGILYETAKRREHPNEKAMSRPKKFRLPQPRCIGFLHHVWHPLNRRCCRPRPQYIGFLPPSNPYHQRVCNCLLEAGFTGVRVGVNKDYSMVTFWLNHDAHSSLTSEFQAHLTILDALDRAGILCEADSLVVDFRAEAVCGAFLTIREG